MIECGQYQTAQVVATRTNVAGQPENVTCLIFGRSPDVLDAVAARIGDVSIDERVAASLAHDVIVRAAKQR